VPDQYAASSPNERATGAADLDKHAAALPDERATAADLDECPTAGARNQLPATSGNQRASSATAQVADWPEFMPGARCWVPGFSP
jgi:hypothetical protein